MTQLEEITARLKAEQPKGNPDDMPLYECGSFYALQDAIAIVTEVLGRDAWRPISEAPSDGTEVDLWLGNDEFPRREENCSYREMTDSEYWAADKPLKGKYWFDCLGFRYKPTHFMPKPQPPAGASDE